MKHAGLLVAIGIFLALAWAPMMVCGSALLSSDETQAYLVERAWAHRGDLAVPYFADVGPGFLRMGTASSGGDQDAGVSRVFMALYVPAAAAGPAGVATMTALFGVVLVSSAYVLARDAAGHRSAAFAAILVAVSPPVLFWAGFDMANLPTTACFVASLACFSRCLATRRNSWATAGVAWAIACVAMRRDSLPLMIPLLLLLGVAAWRMPILWTLVLLTAYGGMAAFRASIGLARSMGDAAVLGPQDFADAWTAISARFAGYHPALDWPTFVLNVEREGLGISTLVAFLALGLAFARINRRAALPVAILAVSGLGYELASFSITAPIIADPPGLFSSLTRYALLGFVASAFIAGLVLARFSSPMARVARTGVVIVIVLACGCQAILAEDGLGWANAERAKHVAVNEASMQLPSDAFLVGDEISKYALERPVLTPNSLLPVQSEFTRPMIDRVEQRHEAAAYIHMDSYEGDWTGIIGDYVTDQHHVTQETSTAPFLRIVFTNSTLANVGKLSLDGWVRDEAGCLVSSEPVSRFWGSPNIADAFAHDHGPGILVSVDYIDNDTGEHQMGYLRVPSRPNDVAPVHAWRGHGDGLVRREEMFLRAGTPANAGLFLSQGLTVLRLDVRVLPEGIER